MASRYKILKRPGVKLERKRRSQQTNLRSARHGSQVHGELVSCKKYFSRLSIWHLACLQGYVHGRKYDFGKSYGNSTRGLPVCSHKSANFGVYMSEHPPKTAIC